MGTTTPPDLEARLPRPAGPGRFDPAELDGLPEPVRRHLGLAIAPGTPLHTSARLRMRGSIKVGRLMSVAFDRWDEGEFFRYQITDLRPAA
jgi:hypothetical protein